MAVNAHTSTPPHTSDLYLSPPTRSLFFLPLPPAFITASFDRLLRQRASSPHVVPMATCSAREAGARASRLECTRGMQRGGNAPQQWHAPFQAHLRRSCSPSGQVWLLEYILPGLAGPCRLPSSTGFSRGSFGMTHTHLTLF